MGEDKLDLRIERTYRLLTGAFERLLASKHYEDVTVSDLCEEAMVRRTTFYKHFADKDAFFAFYVRHIHAEFERRSVQPGEHMSAIEGNTRMTAEFLRFIRENRDLIHMCLTSSAFSVLDAMLFDEISHSLKVCLIEQQEHGEVFCAQPDQLSRYAAGGFLRMLYEFVKTHPDLAAPDVEQFEQQAHALAARLLTPLAEDA